VLLQDIFEQILGVVSENDDITSEEIEELCRNFGEGL
jgi:hypothetical protein